MKVKNKTTGNWDQITLGTVTIDNSLGSDSATHGASVHAVNVGLAEKIGSDGSIEKIIKSDTEPVGTEATIWIEPSDFDSAEVTILKDTLKDEDLDKAPTVHAVKQAIDNVENINYDSLPVRSKIEYTKENQWESTPSGYVESTIPYTLENVGKTVDGLLDMNVYPELGKEKIVGIWIDGKPIYRKIINTGALPNASSKTVNHNIDNIDFITNYYGMAYRDTDNTFIKLPFVQSSQSLALQVAVFINKTIISLVTASDRSGFAISYVIIEYTKTTDKGRNVTISGGAN